MQKTPSIPGWQQIIDAINKKDPSALARWGVRPDRVGNYGTTNEYSVTFYVRNRHTDQAQITIIDNSDEYEVIYSDGTFNSGGTGNGLDEDVEDPVYPDELISVVDQLVNKYDAPEAPLREYDFAMRSLLEEVYTQDPTVFARWGVYNLDYDSNGMYLTIRSKKFTRPRIWIAFLGDSGAYTVTFWGDKSSGTHEENCMSEEIVKTIDTFLARFNF